MIDLYYWTTPNGHKITMFLEEAGLPYRLLPVAIGRGEQFKPEFLKISPNNRIPAIVDQAPIDGGAPIALFESGAILQYLADKTGRFIPQDLRGRNQVLQDRTRLEQRDRRAAVDRCLVNDGRDAVVGRDLQEIGRAHV